VQIYVVKFVGRDIRIIIRGLCCVYAIEEELDFLDDWRAKRVSKPALEFGCPEKGM
jgi:hypothetical protein